jgi:hypothetical protein
MKGKVGVPRDAVTHLDGNVIGRPGEANGVDDDRSGVCTRRDVGNGSDVPTMRQAIALSASRRRVMSGLRNG